MAQLPYSASNQLWTYPAHSGQWFRSVNNSAEIECKTAVNKDTTIGTLTQPSLRLDSVGSFRFRWALTAGNHSITVSAQQSRIRTGSLCPSIVIKANPAIGIPTDVETKMVSGSGWNTITANVSPTSTGATYVELRNNEDSYTNNPCWFDLLVAT